MAPARRPAHEHDDREGHEVRENEGHQVVEDRGPAVDTTFAGCRHRREAHEQVPGVADGGRIRLRGKGVKPVRSSATGDLFCNVEVETPVKLTAEQKKLLGAFDDALKAGGDRHRPRSSSWKDGVRRFFENIGS